MLYRRVLKSYQNKLRTYLPENQTIENSITGSTDKDKKDQVAVNRNNTVIASLILIFAMDNIINFVINTQTDEQLDGLVSKVIKM